MEIKQTNEYSKFKILGGNRNISLLNKNNIIESMKQKIIINPIIVNENMEIIDGQHRFEALKELRKPIYYIIQDGLGLNECQLMNCNSRKWNARDFLNGYCELGYEDYIYLRYFIDKYKFISITVALNILGNTYERDSRTERGFKEGKFKVTNKTNACIMAEQINIFKDTPCFNNNRFQMAAFGMMANLCYDNEKMKKKLIYQLDKVRACTDTKSYLKMFEDIYNYKSPNKIEFKLLK